MMLYVSGNYHKVMEDIDKSFLFDQGQELYVTNCMYHGLYFTHTMDLLTYYDMPLLSCAVWVNVCRGYVSWLT